MLDKLELNEGMLIENIVAQMLVASGHSSIEKFRKKFPGQIHIPYIIHCMDYKEEKGYQFLPIYMTPLL